MGKFEMKHKGFTGSYEISFEDDCLHGRVLFIDDLISYEGSTPAELKQAFIDAVDRYVDHCEKTGKPPNKPYSGTFNVRVGPELHRIAVRCAQRRGMTLNELTTRALQAAVEQEAPVAYPARADCTLTSDFALHQETHRAT